LLIKEKYQLVILLAEIGDTSSAQPFFRKSFWNVRQARAA
jgi:hypothetical protein